MLTVALGLEVMTSDCNDALVVLRTKSSAVTKDVMSVDVVMTETATFTSVVVMTAETSVNNRLERFLVTTDTALVATPFAAAIALLAASVLIPSGKAYATSQLYSTEMTSTSAWLAPDDIAPDLMTSSTLKADRFVRDNFAST
jgi:hypothetical protein